MSLVEKALEKMRQSAAAGGAAGLTAANGAGRASPVYGVVVPNNVHAVAGHPTPPARVIQIDQDALRAAGLLPPAHQERELAQQYRRIKRPLILKAAARVAGRVTNAHLIMMASAMSGEGKTFMSINLAFSMALEKDIHVLLVDADVAKPHISRLLGLEDERGLLDALKDSSLDVETLILPTDVPGLSVLPAGHRAENATELLASSRMQQIVARLGERDALRVVLFDSPPLLLTTESLVLAQVLGQIVLVVRAGITPQQAVLDSVELLGEGKSVSLVLNQSSVTSHVGQYYGYENSPEGAGVR